MPLIPLPRHFGRVHPPLLKGEAERSEERDYAYDNREAQPDEPKCYTHYDRDLLNYRGLTRKGRHVPYSRRLKARSRNMRNNMTKAESILRKRYLKRLKVPVLRQKPLDHYIADFYIPSAKLVIEVDGEIHNTEKAITYDQQRTKILNEYGVRVIRFTNEQIYSGLKEVSDIIGSYLSE